MTQTTDNKYRLASNPMEISTEEKQNYKTLENRFQTTIFKNQFNRYISDENINPRKTLRQSMDQKLVLSFKASNQIQ